VLDNEEAVQRSEGERRNGEEVEGDHRFPVILQKGQPLLPRITPTSDAPQVAGNSAFGNDQAELLQFAMELGCAPIRILLGQAPDQDANLFGDLRPAAAGPRAPTPVEAEAGAMPADDGFGFDDDENELFATSGGGFFDRTKRPKLDRLAPAFIGCIAGHLQTAYSLYKRLSRRCTLQ
jgi:hypothetical protein